MVVYSGYFGIELKDLLALIELKLYVIKPDIETLKLMLSEVANLFL